MTKNAVCGEWEETLQHVIGGCTPLAGKNYLSRHKVLMVLAVSWARKKGTVLQKDRMKLRKANAARRPDLILEDNNKKKIWIVEMACPMEINKEGTKREKITKYQQQMFDMRERRRGYRVVCILVVIGCLGGGISDMRKKTSELFEEKTAQFHNNGNV